jgi:K+-transporting ATPase KdpF subunit
VNVEDVVGLVVVLPLLGYLVYALLFPERLR